MSPYTHACVHCGQFLDKEVWQQHCPALTGKKPVSILHTFALVRRPS
jgi:hypothetical protein